MKSVVGEKGQVTIPKPLRESLGLGPGAEVEFREEDGKLVGRRLIRFDTLGKLVGILPRMDVDGAIERLRGPAWRANLDKKRRGHRGR